MANKNSTYSARSRYIHGGTTEVTASHLEYWERKKISPKIEDGTYELEKIYEGRPELLASIIYGDSKLWWVICQANNILDVQKEFIEGLTLKILPLERITNEVLKGKSGGVPSKRHQRPKISKIIS